jgi:hypothetical protein
MEETGRMTSAVGSVRAVLEGGPPSIPTASRVQTVGPHDEKIKVPHYGGYEHFERAGQLDEHVVHQEVVFRWTMRTEIAE